jgi:hypothetical protein
LPQPIRYPTQEGPHAGTLPHALPTRNHRCSVAGVTHLAEHLARAYGIEVTSLSPLDRDVYRVERADGQPWVAVSTMDGRGVLVTEFVPGPKAEAGART